MQRLAASLLVPLCLAAAPPGDDGPRMVPIAGRVVDFAGDPVAGASLGTSWQTTGDSALPFAQMERITSGDDGAFAAELDVWGFPVTLAAYSADGGLAGWTTFDEQQADDLLIELHPTLRVKGELTRSEIDAPLKWAYGSIDVADVFSVSFQVEGGGRFELLLPRGDLSYMVYDDYFSFLDGEIELTDEQTVVDLGTIDIPAAFLAKQQGKVLPEWTVSDARNVPLDQASLAAQRGKWLLIEFWGFW